MEITFRGFSRATCTYPISGNSITGNAISNPSGLHYSQINLSTVYGAYPYTITDMAPTAADTDLGPLAFGNLVSGNTITPTVQQPGIAPIGEPAGVTTDGLFYVTLQGT